jgi:aryl-alcohol dehydrogenase-like predicted oxidoreductase
MQQTIFGKTGLSVSRTGFGCIPIQRIPYEESTALLQCAYEHDVTLYDTANAYTNSEDRIGVALAPVRDKLVICTKSFPTSPDVVMANIENSLRMLRTDYIDVFQFHNPPFVPRPDGEDGLYDCALKAKEQGKIRYIGITQHSRDRAKEAALSGLYDTLQYPLSYLSTAKELELVDHCRKNNVGLLAMKGLCGGILTNAKAAFAFLRQYDNVLPIWGMQRRHELEEFLSYEENPPVLDTELQTAIDADRAELSGTFCRGCGYCLPCPADIQIPTAARITFLMRRTVSEGFMTEGFQQEMRKIDNCTGCGHCKENCPYEMDTPALLKRQQAEFFEMIKTPL